MTSSILLDARLAAAARYVRRGAVFADVGSDHGHLPIYLVEQGAVSSAIASDISSGSLASARRNIAEHGLEPRIRTVVCDGVAPLCELAPTDIAICGMGGELISDIIDRASFVFDPAIRLILQPMSRPHLLRRYLAERGFRRLSETVCTAAGRVYFCICAEYDGVARELSMLEAYLGCEDPAALSVAEREAMLDAARRLLDATLGIADGKHRAGIDVSEETSLALAVGGFIERLEAIIKEDLL